MEAKECLVRLNSGFAFQPRQAEVTSGMRLVFVHENRSGSARGPEAQHVVQVFCDGVAVAQSPPLSFGETFSW